MTRVAIGGLACAMVMAAAVVANAEVRVARAFSSHMVLQRQMPVRIWGWADKGSKMLAERTSDTREEDSKVNKVKVNKDSSSVQETRATRTIRME